MPILRKETDIFPDHLFDLPVDEQPWEIAHLRSRTEKAVARILLDDGKPFYLPQIKQVTRGADRTFVSNLPLFPGYIFLRRVAGLRRTFWRTNALANIIEIVDQAQLTAELLQIRDLLARGAVLTPCDELVAGDAVRIKDGAFGGYTGVVTEERGAQRLIVSVSILRKSMVVEFPRTFLARVKVAENGREAPRI